VLKKDRMTSGEKTLGRFERRVKEEEGADVVLDNEEERESSNIVTATSITIASMPQTSSL
jgi:hypothetical protein